MRLELGLGPRLVESAGGNEKDRLGTDGGSGVDCLSQGGIEEAFRKLTIGERGA